MTRFTNHESLSAGDSTEERLRRLEERFNLLEIKLPQTFLQGRLRTDYTTAPTSSSDINKTDRLNDVVILTNSQYIIVNDSGSLAWRKVTLESF